MQLRPFKELIGMSKDKLREAMAPIRARQVRSKAELEMSKLEQDILTAETRVQEMCIEDDINLVRILDTLDDIALMEHRKEKYADVLTQLFPETKGDDNAQG